MSDQSQKPKRVYRKRRRAEAEQQTRRRITEAAVDLHGSVGPAKTTVSAIAERAGVQRATVYRHFPDEASLFEACSAHWAAQNPPPDPAQWASIADADERLRAALRDLYRWYERTDYMLEKTIRDAAMVPAMRSAMDGLRAYLEAATATLMRGRRERGRSRARAHALIGHALGFETWRSLVRGQGLASEEAAALMARVIACA